MNNNTTEANMLVVAQENASRAGTSGVSWGGAVLWCAVAAAVLSLILLMLGTGLGLSAVSP